MRTTRTKGIRIAFALLLFAWASPVGGMPPVPRAFKGGVERIDAERQELVITNRHDRVVLAWKQAALHACCVNLGDAVKAYYRKEAGKQIISDLRLLGPTCCQ